MTIRFAILTVSDRSARGERPDTSGVALVDLIRSQGWQIVQQGIVPDEIDEIKDTFLRWCDSGDVDVILSTGGTGFGPRDVTPEAARAVIDRLSPGLDEAMRSASIQVTPHAMLSRSISGIRKRTMIITLPGSPKGAIENIKVVLPALEHAVKLLREEDPGH
jgi:molybdenum cofactor synthesis domain-containing protein